MALSSVVPCVGQGVNGSASAARNDAATRNFDFGRNNPPAAHVKQAKSPSSTARAERVRYVQKTLLDAEKKVEDRLNGNGRDKVSTRDLTNGALLLLQAGRSSSEAMMMLRAYYDAQHMDVTKPDYGTVNWVLGDPSVKDGNAIEFGMQPLGAILIGYGDKLSARDLAYLKPHVQASLVAESHHIVKVSYTNIWLMNTMNTLQLAQYLDDKEQYARGVDQWKQWVAYTEANGIHEFDSPTYNATDIGDIAVGFAYVTDPALRSQFKVALDFIWCDVMASYLPKANRMAGTHSRDYDFLFDRGSMDYYLYIEGIVTLKNGGDFPDTFLEKASVLVNEFNERGYRPSTPILNLRLQPVRVVQQRWGERPSDSRYTYLTQDYALGTTNGKYEAQDKLFAADLTGPNEMPTITLIPDTADAPYGFAKQNDRSGHSKPVHLPLNISSAQEKGLALMTLDLDPRDAKGADTYATNLVLPANADTVMLDGAVAKISRSLELPAHIDSWVGVRAANDCFAGRIIGVQGFQGAVPKMLLKADTVGMDHDAIRLAMYHSSSAVGTPSQEHLHVTVAAAVFACKTDADLLAYGQQLAAAKVSNGPVDGKWNATLELGKVQLHVVEDLGSRLPVTREVNGVAMPSLLLDVNGHALNLEVNP